MKLQQALQSLWNMVDGVLSLNFRFFEFRISFWMILIFSWLGGMLFKFLTDFAFMEEE